MNRLPQLARHTAAPPAAATDAHLLGRWTAGRDEAAFELLVRRHGPMVLAACRRALADPNDADDAFQATFLVLARKAGSVARGEVLAAWLYRVAGRAASRVRADRSRRSGRQEGGVEALPGPAEPDPAWAELSRVLDEEVSRLPARHRAAFVLCCLEGKTGEEAARVLGCPAGTVSSRLTRARERLRDRLARRGFAPAAIALGVFTPAAPAAALIDSTLGAALAFAAGWPSPAPPARPAAVAEGVIRTMILTKLRLAPALLAAGLLAAGLLAGSNSGSASADDPKAKLDPPAGAMAEKADAPDLPVVEVVHPKKGGLDRVSRQACTAEAAQQVDIVPAVAGRLTKVGVQMGDRVKAGQLVAEIDAPGLILERDQAMAGVEQAEGLYREAEARLAAARAEFEAGKGVVKQRQAEEASAKAMLTLREKQYDRLKALGASGSVGQDEVAAHEAQFLTAQAQAQSAVAGVENARGELEVRKGKLIQAEAAIGTAKSNVTLAKLAVRKAELALAQTRLTSPIDGVVTNQLSAPGEFLRGGEAGRSLFTVVRADVVRVVVAIPERDVLLVQKGIPVEVEFHALPGAKFSGKVARLGYITDPKTTTMRTEIDLPNPDGRLRPGMTGNAAIVLGKGAADALRLPARAVLRVQYNRPGKSETVLAVYVYRDGKARLTRVDVANRDGDVVEIRSGVTADDQVVYDPTRFKEAHLFDRDIPVRLAPPK